MRAAVGLLFTAVALLFAAVLVLWLRQDRPGSRSQVREPVDLPRDFAGDGGTPSRLAKDSEVDRRLEELEAAVEELGSRKSGVIKRFRDAKVNSSTVEVHWIVNIEFRRAG